MGALELTMSELTLSGSVPGLFRPYSPVRSLLVPGCVGVVLRVRVEDGTADVCWFGKSTGEGDETEHRVPLDTIGLRLDVDTGRAHAAWWLSERLDYTSELTGVPSAACVLPGRSGFTPILKFGLSVITVDDGEAWRSFDVEDLFNDLDPNDPRTLPDCSRWVDAEALRRVVLHEAGLEV